MTVFGWGRERHSGRYAPLENAGVLRCAQNDDVKLTTARATAKARTTAKAKAKAKAKTKAKTKAKAKAKTKTKYRDLSTAAAKCAAFGRDDVCYGWVEEKGTRVAALPWKMRGFFAALRMTT